MSPIPEIDVSLGISTINLGSFGSELTAFILFVYQTIATIIATIIIPIILTEIITPTFFLGFFSSSIATPFLSFTSAILSYKNLFVFT
jgi:hypothetical protein